MTAVDLPGHGPHDDPHPDVRLADYRDAVLAAIEPGCLLVGHSLGGLSITLAAAARPEHIGALVYLAAFVPEPGERFVEIRQDAISAEVDKASKREGPLSHLLKDRIDDVFYQDCSPEDRAFAAANISPQPISVMVERLSFQPVDVPRHYIRCLNDRVVLPAYQKSLTDHWPPETVHDLVSGHSPFFSDPSGLAHLLDVIASTKR